MKDIDEQHCAVCIVEKSMFKQFTFYLMCIINPRSSINVNQFADAAFDLLSAPVMSVTQYYHILATSRHKVFKITQGTFQETEGITRTKLNESSTNNEHCVTSVKRNTYSVSVIYKVKRIFYISFNA